jgi:diguanylate cyclase (GGDEF)-like protein
VTKMTVFGDLAADARAEVARLLEENEQLRSALDGMRVRVEALEHLADTDPLTPLPNRRYFMREVDRVIRHMARYGTSAAVMYVDLDGLKQINDCLGHRAGDTVLLHVAAILRRDLRSTDHVARIGGDEFGLLLDPVSGADAQTKRTTLMENIACSPIDLDGQPKTISLSIGLAMIRPDDSVETVLARADADMYAAKAAQRSAR